MTGFKFLLVFNEKQFKLNKLLDISFIQNFFDDNIFRECAFVGFGNLSVPDHL